MTNMRAHEGAVCTCPHCCPEKWAINEAMRGLAAKHSHLESLWTVLKAQGCRCDAPTAINQWTGQRAKDCPVH